MPTIKDIAKAAGVSPASVSRVINNGSKVGEKTRQHIKQVMLDMGYYPNANAQAINSLPTASIGLVLADLVNPFFAMMAHGIEQVASETNTQIFMNSGAFNKDAELAAIETLLEHRYQAMVVHSSALSDDILINFAEKIPGFVVINRYIEEISDRCVWLDDQLGGKMMADYIISQGHKNVALICNQKTLDNTAKRMEGAKSALLTQDITLLETNIDSEEATFDAGKIAVQHLIASGNTFTAILAYNDPMAIGAIAMLEAQGLRVPEDVSVIGFDNLMLAQCIKPKLTTIDSPIEKMAITATKLALSLASNNVGIKDIKQKFVPKLVIRQSVKSIFCSQALGI